MAPGQPIRHPLRDLSQGDDDGAPIEPALHGVLVTFRRPDELAAMLGAIDAQTLPLQQLVVVDNEPATAHEQAVGLAATAACYVAAPENLGPAGGLALGMERILAGAHDGDWIVTLDDDDPPRDPRTLEALLAFGEEMRAGDAATAAVGHAGTRFDRRRGRIVRVPDAELDGAVPVDAIAGNQWPLYSVAAVRAVGSLRADLFFGLEELEFGLRLRDHGYTLYGNGAMWRRSREAGGRLGLTLTPARSLEEPTWRRYYSLRNLIVILRDRGAVAAAVRVTVVSGFAKPIVNVVRRPRLALRNLQLNARACRDAWTGRMGRTVEPNR